MRNFSLVYPMFAMVLITATVLAILFRSRVRAVREGKVTNRYYKIYQGEREPEYAAKPARHFSNLFEAPTLFYAVCLVAMVTQQSGLVMQILAWTYVGARSVHAVVHLGSNRLQLRIGAYFFGWSVLLAMWLVLIVRVAMNTGVVKSIVE